MGLCCGDLPSTAKVVGAVCLLVATVAAVLYGGGSVQHVAILLRFWSVCEDVDQFVFGSPCSLRVYCIFVDRYSLSLHAVCLFNAVC